jgi:hypothetical protein
MRSARVSPTAQLVRLVLLLGLAGAATAPAAQADDLFTSSDIPTIYFSDSDNPPNGWMIQTSQNNEIPGSGASSLSIIDDSGGPVIGLIGGSGQNIGSLVVDGSGDVHLANYRVSIDRSDGKVGIGTTAPQGNLHIFGLSAQDVFAGIGPNLVSGPALNFGYAGSSFGRGAGFFNVRPDASATPPNPSLRFATNNVQRLIIDYAGRVSIGVTTPAYPLQMASGAVVTAGGVWTDASSRDVKQDIEPLTADEARAALERLDPVKFAYRAAPAERHVGFIAEDVPDLVASAGRKGLSPMDLVAVLTRVVQEQQKAIAELTAAVGALQTAAASPGSAVRSRPE